ncbi:MAG: hypothetical protein EBR22_00650 [Cytophagia bacterium]|nr:hypothetical protein [Cytophagia bacterium]
MKRDPSFWLLLGLQFLLCFEGVRLDRSGESKPNLRPIYWDVLSYYAYLPALFVEGDLKLTFVGDPSRADVHLHRHRYWPESTADGAKVIKTTMGVALMISPFFGAAHFLAPVLGYEPDGFSRPYQVAVALAGFVWGCLGLWVLRSWLRFFWGPWTVGLALWVLVGATNLWNYLVYEPAMSHSFSFFWMSVLLWCTHRAMKGTGSSVLPEVGVALSLGMLVLIRPTMLMAGLLPLAYSGWSGLRWWWLRLTRHAVDLFLLLFVFLMPWILQTLYWKYVTGHYLFYSYQGERFFWGDPRIAEFLLSYRKGWLLYNPVMVLVVLAWVWAVVRAVRTWGTKGQSQDPFPLATALVWFLPLVIYVYASWWSWWFGGSLGGRALVEWYPALIPAGLGVFGRMLGWIHRSLPGLNPFLDGLRCWLAGLALFFFLGYTVVLQYHQSWQYRIALLHWDSTSKDWYHAVWWQSSFPKDLDQMAVHPNAELARQGRGRSAEIWLPSFLGDGSAEPMGAGAPGCNE